MGSISNSLSNTPAPPVTSSNTGSTFTGSSSFSQDFQNVINRAVAIASLPINLLTAQQTALNSQSTELTALDTKFAALQTAIQGIGDAMGGTAFQATSSNSAVATATVADGAVEGIYSVKVDNVGAYATSLSANSWTATGHAAKYTLVIGNQDYTIAASDDSAATVAATINSQYGNLVHAVAVDVGSSGTHDYRISLQSTSLGATTLDLLPAGATPTSLQQQAPSGYAISQTTKTWDSSGAPAAYTLVVGGNSYLMPAGSDNTAATLAAQINALHGDQVQATVVNLGTLAAPDNRIALQAVTAGAMNLDIQQTPGTSLQTQQTAATSRTTSTWDATSAPAGNRTVYSLLVGSTTYSFTPADNSAATVASTINSLFGSQVQASVIDVGSGSPDLRISLQSKTGGSPALDIQKTTATSLETPKTTGALAQYEINSSGVISTSNTRAVTVANGVTLNLLTTQGLADNPVDITVTRSTSALNTALSTFTDAYNAAVDEVAKQRGQSAGPLEGQSIVSSLSQALTDIATYNSSNGQINGLASLGLDLSKGQVDGHLTYNPFGLLAADLSSSSGVTSFFGSATGGGFLQAATNALNNLEAPATGLVKMAESNTQTQITNIGTTIADKQNKVNALQLQLQNQMAASDALIAAMEQQYSFLSSMFQAQQAASLTMR